MCGIYVEFCLQGSRIVESKAKERLLSLQHRGPDAQKYLFDHPAWPSPSSLNEDRSNNKESFPPQIFLGHTRLAIIDLKPESDQPFSTPDQRYTICFNGEIYNYHSIRKELSERGLVFRTDSDTEVLLFSYATWGRDCLHRLRGMFAFVIWDRVSRKLFMARDRIGQKPLFYWIQDSRLCISSELSTLIRYPQGFTGKLDEASLTEYLQVGHISMSDTLLWNVKQMLPGHYIEASEDDSALEQACYWSLADYLPNPARRTNSLDLERTLQESINLRLIADVPVGIFLSGGVDSTVIAKVARKSGSSFEAFYANYGANPQESAAARTVCDTYGLRLHELDVTKDASSFYLNTLKAFDMPFDGGSAIASYQLFNSVKRQAKVVLTGDAGDETFLGYPYYRTFELLDLAGRTLELIPLLRLIVNPLMGFTPRTLQKKLNLLLNPSILPEVYAEMKSDDVCLSLLRKKSPDDTTREKFLALAKHKNLRGAKLLQYLDITTSLPARMLFKLDRISMHFGIEGRSPLVDSQLVELALSLPAAMHLSLISGGKTTLKKNLRSDFSRSFYQRRKVGFQPAYHSLFREDEVFSLMSCFKARENAFSQFIDNSKAISLAEEGIKGSRLAKQRVWRLLTLANYLERIEKLF